MPLPYRLIVGNWKLHKTTGDAHEFIQRFIALFPIIPPTVTAVVAPPFTALSTVAQAIKDHPGLLLAAQNLHWEDKGAFTGEISGVMLQDLGCRYVIVGHSERRNYFGETNPIVGKKVAAALRHGLKPIVCIGETWNQRDSGNTQAILSGQLRDALASVEPQQANELVIAYEPVWAIGSGHAATPEQASEVHHQIRTQLGSQWGRDPASQIPILYGGSVNPANIEELLATPEVNGALIGGACLDPAQFASMLSTAGASPPGTQH